MDDQLPASSQGPIQNPHLVADAAASPATVLVVDDTPAILTLFGSLLQREGYRVITAGSSKQALAIAAQPGNGLRAAIVDVTISGSHGADLLRHLRQFHPRIKLIAIGCVLLATQEDLLAAEVLPDLFLTKPFSVRELISSLDRLLATR